MSEDAEPETVWYDIRELGVEGRGWDDTKHFYDRLPARAQGVVRDAVWGLSKDSAGMYVRFVTDSPRIAARWTLPNRRVSMYHMPATGVSGLDLYVKHAGKWRWLGIGYPKQSGENEQVLAGGLPAGQRQYMLYLPLYNGVESVELGITADSSLTPAPPWPENVKPICFYGTSITQGGCASRPGMVYSAIIGRRLDWPTLNLGFSGNGTMDPEIAELMAELDQSVYVIACTENMAAKHVTKRTRPLVVTLREAHPDTPIVLVESVNRQETVLNDYKGRHTEQNAALRAAYDRMIAEGIRDLYYVPGDQLYGDDGDATVDGTHATDLGFLRIADVLIPVLRPLLPLVDR